MTKIQFWRTPHPLGLSQSRETSVKFVSPFISLITHKLCISIWTTRTNIYHDVTDLIGKKDFDFKKWNMVSRTLKGPYERLQITSILDEFNYVFTSIFNK